MTQEERIAQLEKENAELRAKLAEAYQQIAQLAERLQQVEGQLAKDSHNRSKPPSSDGPGRKFRSQRQRSEKQTGGQPGHAGQLAPVVVQIADWLSASRLMHADETGVRIAGKLHWLHVNSTGFLTHLAWHAKRGRQALSDIGIRPRFGGRAMRDRWASYDHYQCARSICGAHLVRDCVYVCEQEQQSWAAEMADLLVRMARAADEWRQQGAKAFPADERDAWVAQYFDLLASGFAAQPPPSAEDVPKRGGRRKQGHAMLAALAAVFAGQPLPIAWEC